MVRTREYMFCTWVLFCAIQYGEVTSQSATVHVLLPSNTTLQGFQLRVEAALVDVYPSIPYAKPPVNDLRFLKPQPMEYCQNCVVDVRRLPPACYQDTDMEDQNPGNRMWYNNTEMSEDCLYLSVWAPHVAQAQRSQTPKLPVMIWIYGGSFLSGSNALEVYNGTYLAASQNVIVVSMQYRVGVMGFFYYEDGANVYANQGLWDQNMAMQWVNDNIEHFHGDRNKITIFGESAGAACVGYHLLSPFSEKLFQNAILQSASPLSHWSYETRAEALTKSAAVSNKFQCTRISASHQGSLKCLQKVPMKVLWDSATQIAKDLQVTKRKKVCQRSHPTLCPETSDSYSNYLLTTFIPVIDEEFLPAEPGERLRQLQSNARLSSPKRTILVGTMKNESNFFILFSPGFSKLITIQANYTSRITENTKDIAKDFDPMVALASVILPSHLNKQPLRASIAFQYQLPVREFSPPELKPRQILNLFDSLAGDMDFRCPVLDFGRAFHEMGHQVYMYEFRHRTSSMPFTDWVGTLHGYEIEYIFGQPFNEQFQRQFYPFTDKERQLSKKVMQYWANVAKYNNPNENGTIVNGWPIYTAAEPNYIKFEETSDGKFPVDMRLRERECLFWRKIVPTLNIHYQDCNNGCQSLIAYSWKTISFQLAVVLLRQF